MAIDPIAVFSSLESGRPFRFDRESGYDGRRFWFDEGSTALLRRRSSWRLFRTTPEGGRFGWSGWMFLGAGRYSERHGIGTRLSLREFGLAVDIEELQGESFEWSAYRGEADILRVGKAWLRELDARESAYWKELGVALGDVIRINGYVEVLEILASAANALMESAAGDFQRIRAAVPEEWWKLTRELDDPPDSAYARVGMEALRVVGEVLPIPNIAEAHTAYKLGGLIFDNIDQIESLLETARAI
jgi:hypothetical protein